MLATKTSSIDESIWVSDALLSETFHRFTLASRRRGSNVPGPLEARRRAAKRLNTSLAHTGGTGVPVDPSVLFGGGSQNGWWQTPSPAPNQPQLELVPHFLPSWLAQPVNLPDLSEKWRYLSPPGPTPDAENALGEQNLRQTFQKKLQSTRNLSEIRRLIEELDLDLSQSPVYSELAFDHLLNVRWGLEQVQDFLLDRKFNVTGACNYKKVVIDLTKRIASPNRRKTLLQAIYQGVSVGVVPMEQLDFIIRSLPDVKRPTRNGPVRLGNTRRLHLYYGVILKALSESKVFGIKDLSEGLRNLWIDQMNQAPFDRQAAKFIWLLQVFTAPNKLAAAVDLTKKWLSHLSQEHVLHSNANDFVEFLTHLPRRLLIRTLVATSEELVISPDSGQLSSRLFEVWRDVLCRFDKLFVVQLFESLRPWRAGVKSKNQLRVDEQIMVRWWVATVFTIGTSRECRLLQQLHLPAELLRALDESTDSPLDAYERYSPVLRSLAFPPNDILLRQLRRTVRSESTREWASDVSRFKSRMFEVLRDSRFYASAKHHHIDLLRELAESVNTDIPGFSLIIQRLVAEDRLGPSVATRILKHNLPLQFALNKSWPVCKEQKPLKVELPSAPSEKISCNEVSTADGTSSAFQTAATKLINDLAMAFAVSPAISARQAFRQVFWCFTFLHRYRAPIEPPITKGLWHAGITRRDETGTRVTLTRWILEKIKEIEGPKVAELLQASSDFRQRREAEMKTHEWRSDENLDSHKLGIMDSDQAEKDNYRDGDRHTSYSPVQSREIPDATTSAFVMPPSRRKMQQKQQQQPNQSEDWISFLDSHLVPTHKTKIPSEDLASDTPRPSRSKEEFKQHAPLDPSVAIEKNLVSWTFDAPAETTPFKENTSSIPHPQTQATPERAEQSLRPWSETNIDILSLPQKTNQEKTPWILLSELLSLDENQEKTAGDAGQAQEPKPIFTTRPPRPPPQPQPDPQSRVQLVTRMPPQRQPRTLLTKVGFARAQQNYLRSLAAKKAQSGEEEEDEEEAQRPVANEAAKPTLDELYIQSAGQDGAAKPVWRTHKVV